MSVIGLLALTLLTATQPSDRLAPGVTVWAYQLEGKLPRRPTVAEGQTPNVYFVSPVVDFKDGLGEGEARVTGAFAGEVKGWIEAPVGGVYAFKVNADDGAAVVIDGQVVADTERPENDAFVARGAVTLTPGWHALSIPFYQDRGEFKLKLSWRVPGAPDDGRYELVPAAALKTEAGQTFAVSPGVKRWFIGEDPNRPGDGRPLEGVHPWMRLEDFRPRGFEPPVGAMCFLPDGRLAMATWEPSGSVYLLDGLKNGPVSVKRFASGLGEPLGMAVVNGELLVTQKGEITRLKDTDGDGVADVYESVASGWGMSHNYHEFCFNLVERTGPDAGLYFTTSVPLKSGVTMYLPGWVNGQEQESAFPVPEGPGSVWRVDAATGTVRAIARGLRAPNGLCTGVDGWLFCCDNQGAWLPSSRLNLIREGGFYGHQRKPDGREASDPPVVWFPQGEIGNSPSEPVLIPDGPYRGQMLVGDVTYGGIQRVVLDWPARKPGDGPPRPQGCVLRFSQGLEAGVNRLAWGPDGCLYVGGVGSNGNWNHRGKKFGLQRLRPGGPVPFEIDAVRARPGGFVIDFTAPLAEAAAGDASRFEVETWRYRPTVEYGGPKIDLTPRPADRMLVSDDRRSVFIGVPGLEAGTVAHLRLRGVTSEAGEAMWSTEAWYTLNELPSAGEAADAAFDGPRVRPELIGAGAPPAGAQVLFDGHGLEKWSALDGSPPHWIVNGAGELEVSLARGGINAGDLVTREKFGDCFVHVEWLSPAGGDREKQTNANSGVKLQERYEIQIMNSPGFEGGREPAKFNEAGAIYRQKAADVNASLGAGVWQVYDIRFRAPRWDGEKKVENARITLWWNGVKVQDDVEVKDKTGASKAEAPGEHPLLLQAHPSEAGGPVKFRNVWVRRE